MNAKHDNKSSEDLAVQRTKWAEDRTLMANERTFSSWMGTGLGAVGVAIGMKAVFGAFEPTWAAKLVSSIFLLAAILLFWTARQKAMQTFQELNDTNANTQTTKAFTLLATVMTIAALATGAILWSL